MIVPRPALWVIPNMLAIAGSRRSPSTSRTRLPRCASTIAEFALTVVFPSFGKELVTRITRGGVPKLERMMEVRSARKDSAAGDLGCAYATKGRQLPFDPGSAPKVLFR